MSFHSDYMIRKELRAELHKKRCEDKDQSPQRLAQDAQWLNDKLAELGITSQRNATWGR